MTRPLSPGPVPDLIVVLQIGEKFVAGHVPDRPPMSPAPEGRIAPVVDEYLLEGLGEIGQRSEVFIISVALSGEHGVQGVVEIVAPLGVHPVAAGLARLNDAGIVQVALRYQ